MINLVCAMGNNREIGSGNKLLWKLPEDMRRFRNITMETTVVMGRKTYESIGKPLVNRFNIVLTKDLGYASNEPYLITVESIEHVLKLAAEEDIYVIGGEQIYEAFLPYADRLFLTTVDGTFPEADTFFPEYKHLPFRRVKAERYEKDDRNSYGMTFQLFVKELL